MFNSYAKSIAISFSYPDRRRAPSFPYAVSVFWVYFYRSLIRIEINSDSTSFSVCVRLFFNPLPIKMNITASYVQSANDVAYISFFNILFLSSSSSASYLFVYFRFALAKDEHNASRFCHSKINSCGHYYRVRVYLISATLNRNISTQRECTNKKQLDA